jgi:hypothetical protein
VPLLGGMTNRGLVVRVGETVRRPRTAASPATEALLEHLGAVAFDGAPRFLGIDEQGRQVLSYIEGETVTAPYPAWALTDAALVSVVELLRGYHDAVAGFDAAAHSWANPVPPAFAGTVVTHNDANLDNVVFRDGRAVALIDFDLAAPGTRVWDVGAAARLWVPLRRDDDIDDARRGRVLERLQLVVDTYRLPAGERERLLEAVVAAHDWSYDIVRGAARRGHAQFLQYLRGGAGERADRTRRWYDRDQQLRAALRPALSRRSAPG